MWRVTRLSVCAGWFHCRHRGGLASAALSTSVRRSARPEPGRGTENTRSNDARRSKHSGWKPHSPFKKFDSVRVYYPSRARGSSHALGKLFGDVYRHNGVMEGFKGMEFIFLGTGAQKPSPSRNVSSIALRLSGEIWLFDCGEGTQHRFAAARLRPARLTNIFISHLHGDHLYGLPGLLAYVLNAKGQQRPPLHIHGPVGIRSFVRMALHSSFASTLAFPIHIHEYALPPETLGALRSASMLSSFYQHKVEVVRAFSPPPLRNEGPSGGDEHGIVWPTLSLSPSLSLPACGWEMVTPTAPTNIQVSAYPLQHRVGSFGFVIREAERPGTLNPVLCKELGLPPGPAYAHLKSGRSVLNEMGVWVHPDQVIGPALPGRSVVLLGDTCDSSLIQHTGINPDVLIHEATLLDEDESKAYIRGHSTAGMAGSFAARMKAKTLVLTHFSSKFVDNEDLSDKHLQDLDRATVGTLHLQARRSNANASNVVAAEDFMRLWVDPYGTGEERTYVGGR